MMSDILHCAESMKFGLPEITLGTIPGAGGTQRLAQAIGKSRAFELILTGESMGAEEALRRGLVSRVFPDHQLLDGSIALAEKIAQKSLVTLRLAKESINASQNNIAHGLQVEQKLYHMSFSTDAFQEGVQAFLQKRPPNF